LTPLLIDEAQFLTEAQVFECAKIVDDLKIPVMCYGLKTDFMGKLFSGSEALLRLADNIEEIKTICWCGKKATQTARITPKGDVVREGAQIQIGGNDLYISLCRKHFIRGEASAQKANEQQKEKRRLMGTEPERKFLLNDDSWKAAVTGKSYIVQAYLSKEPGRTGPYPHQG
jgi:CYTH domain-containing protein